MDPNRFSPKFVSNSMNSLWTPAGRSITAISDFHLECLRTSRRICAYSPASMLTGLSPLIVVMEKNSMPLTTSGVKDSDEIGIWSLTPSSSAAFGLLKSASMRATEPLFLASSWARFIATSVFPVPPFPERTST